MRDLWFEKKFAVLRRCAWLAMAGVPLVVSGLFTRNAITQALELLLAFFLIFPLILTLTVVPVLHWKDRYKGKHSNLWGALLVIETSGWFKIVYWFRHILPDSHDTGRYSRTTSTE
jgi:hypothetical protein